MMKRTSTEWERPQPCLLPLLNPTLVVGAWRVSPTNVEWWPTWDVAPCPRNVTNSAHSAPRSCPTCRRCGAIRLKFTTLSPVRRKWPVMFVIESLPIHQVRVGDHMTTQQPSPVSVYTRKTRRLFHINVFILVCLGVPFSGCFILFGSILKGFNFFALPGHLTGLIYHKRTEHFEEKRFTCQVCDLKFGANSSLKNHMRLHTGEKPYHCKHCTMSFSVAAALAYHTKKKHSEGRRREHKNKSNIFWPTRQWLKPENECTLEVNPVHFVFSPGKMYECQYCKASFAQSIELTRHVRTHTGDRPYVCRECGKGYSQASGLTVHLNNFHSK